MPAVWSTGALVKCTSCKASGSKQLQAMASIGAALVHAESADLKYILKKLNEMPQAVTVLAGLLRDGTFQKSIEAKQNDTASTGMLPGKYRKFKQLGARYILEMMADWEVGLEPGERLPPKVKKSQKEGMDEMMKLLEFVVGSQMFPDYGYQMFSVVGSQIFRVFGSQIFRVSGSQISRVSGSQIFRVSGPQIFRVLFFCGAERTLKSCFSPLVCSVFFVGDSFGFCKKV
jgi:hypothetical protein